MKNTPDRKESVTEFQVELKTVRMASAQRSEDLPVDAVSVRPCSGLDNVFSETGAVGSAADIGGMMRCNRLASNEKGAL